jgi:hypothetical protein
MLPGPREEQLAEQLHRPRLRGLVPFCGGRRPRSRDRSWFVPNSSTETEQRSSAQPAMVRLDMAADRWRQCATQEANNQMGTAVRFGVYCVAGGQFGEQPMVAKIIAGVSARRCVRGRRPTPGRRLREPMESDRSACASSGRDLAQRRTRVGTAVAGVGQSAPAIRHRLRREVDAMPCRWSMPELIGHGAARPSQVQSRAQGRHTACPQCN